MTQDQINTLIRQFLMIVGGGIGTWFARKGLLSTDDLSFFAANGPALVGLVMAAGGMIWGTFAHKQVNMVATVAAMPEVKKVETVATQAGNTLAVAANDAAGPAGTVVAAKS